MRVRLGKLKELAYVFKTIWKFLTKDPKEMTDQDWKDVFIIGEAIRQTRKMSDRRRNNRSMYGMRRIYSNKRRYYH